MPAILGSSARFGILCGKYFFRYRDLRNFADFYEKSCFFEGESIYTLVSVDGILKKMKKGKKS